MATTPLLHYFQPKGQHRALEAYIKFATGSAWSVSSKMDLYGASRTAFDPRASPEQGFLAFKTIYDTLRGYWQVFRTSKRDSDESPWTATDIFERIRKEFVGFGWDDPVQLPNLLASGKHQTLMLSMLEMRGIKAHKDFPTMTVSKFLHFYNPGLFPIYDNEVVWNRVFKRFKQPDYNDFCASVNLATNADGAAFLRNYMCWGSSLLSSAHARFMPMFVDWLEDELPRRKFEAVGRDTLGRLYATAFEFTAIGAAVFERRSSGS
jgi:hypothetical protein